MDWKTALTLLTTISIALTGYLATYRINLKLAQRKDRLDRVNRQLREFYGPLFILIHTGSSAWDAFRSKYRPDSPSYWRSQPPPTEEEKAAWRLWMSEVFMPLNLRMERIIIENADLLDETEMPTCLLDLCAHISTYKTILERWESGDFSEHASISNFPGEELLAYAEKTYLRLRAEQAILLEDKRLLSILFK